MSKFFGACNSVERALFATLRLTALREMEVVHLFWSDINLDLQTVRVTAKPELGFYPKRWKKRELPILVILGKLLKLILIACVQVYLPAASREARTSYAQLL